MIREILDGGGIDPATLLLEITESVLMGDHDSAESALRSLRAPGVRFALDGFGTGYSPLSHLQRFPVAVIKIDRSIIGDSTRNSGDRRIVDAIVRMAHGLGPWRSRRKGSRSGSAGVSCSRSAATMRRVS